MIDAMKLKSAEDMIDGNSMKKEYTFPNSQLDVQGNQPNGLGSVDKDGRIAIAVYDGKWCATKSYIEGTITIKEYVEGECILPVEKEDDVVVIEGEPIREKIASLVLDENGNCKSEGTYEYMGGCYIKAAPSTTLANHVWYNGFLWRIMGINNLGTENESIKMITEENITSIKYNDANNVDFADGAADIWLNTYFYNKLSNENNLKTDILVAGTFCQGNKDNSGGEARIDCTDGTLLTRNVGLITIDEYLAADTYDSYLVNGQHFWTMSPSNRRVWHVDEDGIEDDMGTYSSPTNEHGIRPIINVKVSSTITSGSGTLNDFYVLGEDKTKMNTTKKLSSVKVGEYVSLNDKTYRVVENGDITKLILDGYYTSNVAYGTTDAISTTSGIGLSLSGDVLNFLIEGSNQDKLKSMILSSDWYPSFYDYTGTSAETATPVQLQVGLIRKYEILSAQSYTMLTNNGTEVSSYENVLSYWVMPYMINTDTGNTYAEYVTNGGYFDSVSVTSTNAVRPVINLSSDLTITSGNGTIGHEYVIVIK